MLTAAGSSKKAVVQLALSFALWWPTQGYCSCWTVVQWWTAWPVFTGSVTTTQRRAWPWPCRSRCTMADFPNHVCVPNVPDGIPHISHLSQRSAHCADYCHLMRQFVYSLTMAMSYI